jgi:polyhydroxyalkanoate synthase subunit PhaC
MVGIRQAYFTVMDEISRAQADALAACGLGPVECDYCVLASGPHWRLRAYEPVDGWASVLIVSAPIKRPYVWDIDPSRSVIRYCLDQRLAVYLLEWKPAALEHGNAGLEEYAGQAISECVAEVARYGSGRKPFLMGHSLGGTLAAIHAALEPQALQGLVLIGAPLCFEAGVSCFRDSLVRLVPADLSDTDVVPGSLLSRVSALASPRTFVWERLMDAALSMADARALAIHARVERWALDEVALPGRLVHQIVQWLYHEDRFCRGTLRILNTEIGPSSLGVPILVVLNTADEIAPPASMTGFLHATANRRVKMITYSGETGVGLQHLALLVGRKAYDQVWPEVIAWLKAF